MEQESRGPRGFFAVLREVMGDFGRALRRLGLRGFLRGLGEVLKELFAEVGIGLALLLIACGIGFATLWGLRTYPVATGLVLGPVAAFLLFGAVLAIQARHDGKRYPYGRLGAAAAGTFGFAVILLVTVAQAGGCATC